MEKKVAVLFDMDGTIIDSIPDITLNVNKVLAKYGYKERSEEEVINFVGNGARKIVERSIGETVDKEKLDIMLKEYNELYTNNACVKSRVYDGIETVLTEFKKRGYKLCIITNKPQQTTDKVYDFYFKKFGFDKVVGQSATVITKPDKTQTELFLTEQGIEKQNAYFVGDGETDVLTAKNAGINCIACLWGNRSKEILKEAGATVFANTPLDLLDLVK